MGTVDIVFAGKVRSDATDAGIHAASRRMRSIAIAAIRCREGARCEGAQGRSPDAAAEGEMASVSAASVQRAPSFRLRFDVMAIRRCTWRDASEQGCEPAANNGASFRGIRCGIGRRVATPHRIQQRYIHSPVQTPQITMSLLASAAPRASISLSWLFASPATLSFSSTKLAVPPGVLH